MVESEAKELVGGDVMLERGDEPAIESFQKVIDAIIRAGRKKPPRSPSRSRRRPDHSALLSKAIAERSRRKRICREGLQDQGQAGRPLRRHRRGEARSKVNAAKLVKSDANPAGANSTSSWSGEGTVQGSRRRKWFAATILRHRSERIDGRNAEDQVRPDSCRKSACFRARTVRHCSPAARRSRSCVATLGTAEDEQWLDGLEGTCEGSQIHAALQLPALLQRW